MSTAITNPGLAFRRALSAEKPLQIPGTINAFSALLAERAGFRALYLSGAGVANASLGVPDLGISSCRDVLEDVWRITEAVDLPLLVDIDTGWGNHLVIARTIKQMIKAGAAAVHIEDQTQDKRCGHRPGKAIVSITDMVDRLHAAVDAKTDPHFVIMARTDALAIEGIEKTLERIQHYVAAGAEMIFFEGAESLEQYQAVKKVCSVPVLANITEFGVTPLFTTQELASVGVDMVLYPLSAFRAMSKAAEHVYTTLRHDLTQKNILNSMQTREQLYDILNYYAYEEKKHDTK